jgi:hypothetical protein
MMNGWIGVDLDGTLAEYHGWKGPEVIGPAIPLMLERVKRWLSEGKVVKILTARVSHDGTPERQKDAATALLAIQAWCELYIGCALPVTNEKDYAMVELWDDRAVGVIPNTGEAIGRSA